jgi:hypothetical protein
LGWILDQLKVTRFCISGSARTDHSNAHANLVSKLENLGWVLSDVQNSDVLISMNHDRTALKEFKRSEKSGKTAILVRVEPEVVFPMQYRAKITSQYYQVITPGAVKDFAGGRFFVGWPYIYLPNPAKPDWSTIGEQDLKDIVKLGATRSYVDWLNRPFLVAQIASNKVSALRSSNYELRRKFASKNSVTTLKTYGSLWNESILVKITYRFKVFAIVLRNGTLPSLRYVYGNLFKKYKTATGSIQNKHEIIRSTKYSLVIENSNEYVSEKLFDAIMGGSVPLYIGPPLKDVGLPTNIAIEIETTDFDLDSVIKNFSTDKIMEVLACGQDFLNSELFFLSWSFEGVNEKLVQEIKLGFESGKHD